MARAAGAGPRPGKAPPGGPPAGTGRLRNIFRLRIVP
jgi:hypothetical protein